MLRDGAEWCARLREYDESAETGSRMVMTHQSLYIDVASNIRLGFTGLVGPICRSARLMPIYRASRHSAPIIHMTSPLASLLGRRRGLSRTYHWTNPALDVVLAKHVTRLA
jgi:hypothetical protein